MPLVSIIVPVYKAENVLYHCVDSILSQTFDDFELILVDDGSPDNSGKICDDYAAKDERIKVVHKGNDGVSMARNTGIEHSSGKYICFIDSDDYIRNDYLENLIYAKTNNPQYDNIWCKFRTVDNYKEELSPKGIEIAVEEYSVKDIMTLHEMWLDAGPYCKLYDREIIINNHIFFPTDITLGEDLSFNFCYLDNTNGKIAVINNTLYYYYTGDQNSLSNRYYPDMFNLYIRLNNMMLSYLTKWKCDSKQLKKFYNASFFKYECVLKNTLSKKNKLSKREKIKYNNSIIESEVFQEAYKKGDFYLNILYRIAYSFKSYRLVMLVEKIFSILK